MQTQDSPMIFIVEDNSIYNKLIASHLRSNNFKRIESFLSGEECLKNLHKNPDIVIQDYLLNGINGLEVLKETKKKNPKTEFIFISAQESIDVAIDTIRHGASDYVVKNQFAFKKLIDKIHDLRKTQKIKHQNNYFKMSLLLFIIVLASLILVVVSIAIISPETFSH